MRLCNENKIEQMFDNIIDKNKHMFYTCCCQQIKKKIPITVLAHHNVIRIFLYIQTNSCRNDNEFETQNTTLIIILHILIL